MSAKAHRSFDGGFLGILARTACVESGVQCPVGERRRVERLRRSEPECQCNHRHDHRDPSRAAGGAAGVGCSCS